MMVAKVEQLTIAVVIPTYQRGPIVCQTLAQLLSQLDKPDQIIVVDQTKYSAADESYLQLIAHHELGEIVLLERDQPSIPAAMNVGLRYANTDYVLFLDDDIEIDRDFIGAHRNSLGTENARTESRLAAQVGQVLQPEELPESAVEFKSKGIGINRDLDFKFYSANTAQLENCMAGNLCVERQIAISVGGFDENFGGAAYRFETEFARRLCRHTGQKIFFTPSAGIRHLQWQSGGTRSHANHLSSSSPIHSAGDYYFSFLEAQGTHRLIYQLRRLLFGLRARFYLRRPWFIPIRLLGEWRGYRWAKRCSKQGPKLMHEATNLPRLAVLMSHPTQHFAPVYRALADSEAIQLKVFFLSETGLISYYDPGFDQELQWDVPLNEGYRFEFLSPGKVLESFTFWEMDNTQVNKMIHSFKPDVIWLHGYAQKANWRVALNTPNNARILYTSDSNIDDRRAWYREFAKQVIVRIFLSRCDKYIVFSDRNERYLLKYGADKSKIVKTSFPIDIHRWQELSDSISHAQKAKTRASLGFETGATVFLFAGKLEKHKGANDAVEAIAEASLNNQYLLIIGSGPESKNLNLQIKSLGLEKRVVLLGFKNQSELAEYFAASDVLVFPSHREPYGTIAAEVLPFSLPIIAASGIGAIGSAIVENENAILYPAGDIKAFANAMLQMTSSEQREKYSLASKRMAPMHDKSELCEQIIKLCYNESDR